MVRRHYVIFCTLAMFLMNAQASILMSSELKAKIKEIDDAPFKIDTSLCPVNTKCEVLNDMSNVESHRQLTSLLKISSQSIAYIVNHYLGSTYDKLCENIIGMINDAKDLALITKELSKLGVHAVCKVIKK